MKMDNGGGFLCDQAAGERVVAGWTVPSEEGQDPHDLSAGWVEGGADGQPQRHAEPGRHTAQNPLGHRRDGGAGQTILILTLILKPTHTNRRTNTIPYPYQIKRPGMKTDKVIEPVWQEIKTLTLSLTLTLILTLTLFNTLTVNLIPNLITYS